MLWWRNFVIIAASRTIFRKVWAMCVHVPTAQLFGHYGVGSYTYPWIAQYYRQHSSKQDKQQEWEHLVVHIIHQHVVALLERD